MHIVRGGKRRDQVPKYFGPKPPLGKSNGWLGGISPHLPCPYYNMSPTSPRIRVLYASFYYYY